jgi:4a-hydroxytetrahydrobiopterin dehydratase
MELLNDEQVEAELATVPGWSQSDSSIVTVVTRKDFRDALLFLNAVGYLAERAGHHPDVVVSWNKVTLTLSTHSAGGLTDADFGLAREINALRLPGPGAIFPRICRPSSGFWERSPARQVQIGLIRPSNCLVKSEVCLLDTVPALSR